MYYRGDGVTKNYYEAFKWLEMAAKAGVSAAQDRLGECDLQGHGVLKNETAAVQGYTAAANQGNERGKYHLGYCYYNGYGVKKDKKYAKQLGYEGKSWF